VAGGLNVVMLGPPGAGKGTQASRFAHDRGLAKISTGDMLREGIRDRNPVALEAKARIDRGELVDDATMIAIVKDRLRRDDTRAGFVLDGFPRTVAQALALDAVADARRNGPLVVVDIAVPESVLVARLSARRICGSCGLTPDPLVGPRAACAACGGAWVQRPDDDPAVVVERLRVYERSTRAVLDHYRGRSTFRTVNGAQAPDQVARDLVAAVDDAAAGRVTPAAV
jgi:adenylate kinase